MSAFGASPPTGQTFSPGGRVGTDVRAKKERGALSRELHAVVALESFLRNREAEEEVKAGFCRCIMRGPCWEG